MIKCAIFDFDGTLANSMALWRNVGEGYLRSIGIEPKEDADAKLKELRVETASQYFVDEYKLDMTKEQVLKGITGFVRDRYMYDVTLKDGLVEFLQTLKEKNIKTAVATANDLDLIGVVLKKYDVEKYFDEMINCEMVGADKTEPKIFEEAMKLLGGSKDDTVIFEDAYYAIKTAKNADFKVVGVYDEVEDEPDKVKEIVDLYIEDYKDINRILNV